MASNHSQYAARAVWCPAPAPAMAGEKQLFGFLQKVFGLSILPRRREGGGRRDRAALAFLAELGLGIFPDGTHRAPEAQDESGVVYSRSAGPP